MIRMLIQLIFCLTFLFYADDLSAAAIDDVRQSVLAWGEAWQNRDIERYISHYSPAFYSKGYDYHSWKAKKASIFQENDSIEVEISDLWVLIEGKHAIATFIQRYQDRAVTDLGEKTLVLIKSNHSWKIVSENWRPMAIPPRSIQAPKVAQKTAKPDSITRNLFIEDPAVDIKGASKKSTRIKNNLYKTGGFGEKIYIRMNRFSVPKVQNLNTDKPRIVMDVFDVQHWNGPSKIPVNGKRIRQLRTYLHQNLKMLRIVLDLNPAKDYIINQIFFKSDNTHCVEIR